MALYELLHNCRRRSLAGYASKMPKKKPRKFRAVQAVKAAAREQIGTPPPTRRQPQRKKAAEQKHKPTLGDMLAEE